MAKIKAYSLIAKANVQDNDAFLIETDEGTKSIKAKDVISPFTQAQIESMIEGFMDVIPEITSASDNNALAIGQIYKVHAGGNNYTYHAKTGNGTYYTFANADLVYSKSAVDNKFSDYMKLIPTVSSAGDNSEISVGQLYKANNQFYIKLSAGGSYNQLAIAANYYDKNASDNRYEKSGNKASTITTDDNFPDQYNTLYPNINAVKRFVFAVLANYYSIDGGKISTLEQRVETAIKSTSMITKDSDTQLNGDYNNLTPNAIYTIGSSSLSAENAPYSGFIGQIHVFDFNTTRSDSNATTIQIAYSSAGRVLSRMLFKSPRVWSDWAELRNKDDYTNVLHSYTTMIVSDTTANSVFGNDYDNLPENSIVCIGYKSTTAQNIPYIGFLGNVISVSYREGAINGITQIAISGTNRLLHRIKWGAAGVWSSWVEDAPKANVYYVGGDSEHQSLTQLFIDLAGDTTEKIIYVNPGTYDIYQEYRDAQIPTPPDDVTSSDYLTRCVFVPPNTKLIGVGNVMLEWNPSKDEITYGESRTWSPLNVRYVCYVENISIHCKYGRYCIHDDSHNATDDQGVTHTYKNVRCIYEYSEDGYGFNNALGFGFSQKNNYIFEDCRFEIITNGNNSAFYGHSSSGKNLNINESPNVIIKNCIVIGGSNNVRVVRLQSLNKSALKIRTLIENCYIDGGIYLTLYYDDAVQAFDVTLLKSGNPTQTIDQPENNPYPINIYE